MTKTTMSLKVILGILFVARLTSLSQTTAQKFVDALIYDKENIAEYINKDELTSSARLGITYNGVKSKILIGTEIPEEIKAGIISGKYQYYVKEEQLTDGFISATLSIPAVNYENQFYFKGGFVSSAAYYTLLWEKKESRYFKFRISEPKYFNEYCIKRLDDFVDMTANTLGYTASEKELLEKKKIIYTFCRDEAEVKMLTGYGAKGMALLGNDEVITSYQTHFHEVAHILINFKLKKLGLYTLPFFMEGFAVALGGRGGMAPRVVTDLGYYLQKTGLLTYDSILTDEQFRNNDGSMSYPVSGLYNSFLLGELGGEKYLELYKKVNGDLEYVKGIKVDGLNQLNENQFILFLEKYRNDTTISLVAPKLIDSDMGRNLPGLFKENKNKIGIYCKNKMSIWYKKNSFTTNSFQSRLYESIFEDKYSGYYYGIISDSTSIRVYNFLNDELIFSYDKNFSISGLPVPVSKNYFYFFINKEIFDFDLYKFGIIMLENTR